MAIVVIKTGRRSDARRFRDRRDFAVALLLQLIREFDDEDAVLGNQADQRDQTDLRVNVKTRRPAVGEKLQVRVRRFSNMKIIAPKSASGTEPSRMMNGSRKLLNCAARTRKIRMTARPKAGRNLSPSTRS